MAEVGGAPERDVHQAAPAAWAGGATDQLFRLLVSAVRDYAILDHDFLSIASHELKTRWPPCACSCRTSCGGSTSSWSHGANDD